jgi:hypothetical protein
MHEDAVVQEKSHFGILFKRLFGCYSDVNHQGTYLQAWAQGRGTNYARTEPNMSDTLLASLTSALKPPTLEEISKGLGESQQGRALNRRISMLVTQK